MDGMLGVKEEHELRHPADVGALGFGAVSNHLARGDPDLGEEAVAVVEDVQSASGQQVPDSGKDWKELNEETALLGVPRKSLRSHLKRGVDTEESTLKGSRSSQHRAGEQSEERALCRGITQKNERDHTLGKNAHSLRARPSVFLSRERDTQTGRPKKDETDSGSGDCWVREGEKPGESESRHDTDCQKGKARHQRFRTGRPARVTAAGVPWGDEETETLLAMLWDAQLHEELGLVSTARPTGPQQDVSGSRAFCGPQSRPLTHGVLD
ncbi:zinc finger and SCAN domain-containing protein 32 [Enhydra lutris kenyoni]|uniref:Zinc finger and SCAN domain-containing protein 32 n=1 Tax=Enhydra lutris kenyoni TaxID=391180 RepID=A0A2Y9KG21_ENHLU|nr:zinc finger and SCAN domain-containing protein 32 [Enhydra lutris kenyoni]